jgi:hypothetical protein
MDINRDSNGDRLGELRAERDGGSFPLPDRHLLQALWCAYLALSVALTAWQAVTGGEMFVRVPGFYRGAAAVFFSMLFCGVVAQTASAWRKYRRRGAGPEIERIDG